MCLGSALLVGCGGSSNGGLASSGDTTSSVDDGGGSADGSSATSSGTDTSSAAGSSSSPAPVRGGKAGICSAFDDFYNTLLTQTPHDIADLVPAAQRVQQAALVDPNRISHRLSDDANNLVAFVGSSSFTNNGNVMSKPIVRVQSDCGE